MAVQRLIFGFRVHEAPQMGHMGETKPKGCFSKLLVGLGLFHFDFRVDFVSPNKPPFVGGLFQHQSNDYLISWWYELH